MRGWLILFAVVATSLTRPALLPAQVLLRYRFELNETLRYKVTQETTAKLRVGGQGGGSSAVQTTHVSHFVRDINEDGAATVQLTIERVRLSLITPAQVNRPFEYDSSSRRTDSAPPGYAELMGQLVGARFLVEHSDRGEIVPLDVPEPLLERLQNAPAAARIWMPDPPENLRQLITQTSLTLPQSPVRPGDVWEAVQTVALPQGPAELRQVWTYEGTAPDGLDRIGVRHEPSPDAPQAGLRETPVRLVSSTGTILFDSTRGELTSMNVLQKFVVELPHGGQQHYQEIDQRIRVERE